MKSKFSWPGMKLLRGVQGGNIQRKHRQRLGLLEKCSLDIQYKSKAFHVYLHKFNTAFQKKTHTCYEVWCWKYFDLRMVCFSKTWSADNPRIKSVKMWDYLWRKIKATVELNPATYQWPQNIQVDSPRTAKRLIF